MKKHSKKFFLYDRGNFVGIYNVAEIMEITGCSEKIPTKYSRTWMFYKGRYQFMRIESNSFGEEWDNVRNRILSDLQRNKTA